MTPCDVIRVYTKMNWNFKGGTNNVMIKYNDIVDSRRLQQCTDDNHSSLAHTSARNKQIREKGRLGYVDTPVPDADWLYSCTVRFVPVGDIRIGYLRSAVDREQSTELDFLRYGVEKPACSRTVVTSWCFSGVQDNGGCGVSRGPCRKLW